MSSIEPKSPLQRFQEIKAKALKNMGRMNMDPGHELKDRCAELKGKINELAPLKEDLKTLKKTKAFQHKKGEKMLTSCKNIFSTLKAKHQANQWIKKIDHQVSEYKKVIEALEKKKTQEDE